MCLYINSTWLPAWPWQLPGFGRYTWWRLAVVAKLSCTKTSWPQGLLPWSTFHEVAYVTARRLIKTHGQGKLRILGRRLRLWDLEGSWRQDETSTSKLYAAGFRRDIQICMYKNFRSSAETYEQVQLDFSLFLLQQTEWYWIVGRYFRFGTMGRLDWGCDLGCLEPTSYQAFAILLGHFAQSLEMGCWSRNISQARPYPACICRRCFGGNQLDWLTMVGSSWSILDLMIHCRFMTYSISWFWLIDFATLHRIY